MQRGETSLGPGPLLMLFLLSEVAACLPHLQNEPRPQAVVMWWWWWGAFPRVPSLVCELQASTLGREYALYHSVIALSGEGERSGSA